MQREATCSAVLFSFFFVKFRTLVFWFVVLHSAPWLIIFFISWFKRAKSKLCKIRRRWNLANPVVLQGLFCLFFNDVRNFWSIVFNLLCMQIFGVCKLRLCGVDTHFSLGSAVSRGLVFAFLLQEGVVGRKGNLGLKVSYRYLCSKIKGHSKLLVLSSRPRARC